MPRVPPGGGGLSAARASPGADWRWLAAAALAGGASVAGFGDWNLFPLPLLALGLLFFAWTRTSAPRAAAGLGLAYGAGLFLVGVSWVYVSLHDFGMMPAPLAATATLLFCLYLALFPAAVGYLQARIPAALPLRLMLVMPALWTLAEWVRSWLFTGFPWLVLGYSQADGPLAGFGPILGVLGVSFLAAVAAGALAALAAKRRAAAPGPWRPACWSCSERRAGRCAASRGRRPWASRSR